MDAQEMSGHITVEDITQACLAGVTSICSYLYTAHYTSPFVRLTDKAIT